VLILFQINQPRVQTICIDTNNPVSVNIENYGSTTILVDFAITQRLLVDDMIDDIDLNELYGSSSSPPQLTAQCLKTNMKYENLCDEG
jgi:hypothetical protein